MLNLSTSLCRLAYRLGARHVHLTDHDPKSLSHMRHDCAKNGVEANVVSLDWYRPEVDFITSREDLMVIAGDVLYKRSLIAPFVTTTKLLLQSQGSAMLLCHVPRAGVSQEEVQLAAREHGLQIEGIARELWEAESLRLHASQEEIDSAELYSLTTPDLK